MTDRRPPIKDPDIAAVVAEIVRAQAALARADAELRRLANECQLSTEREGVK